MSGEQRDLYLVLGVGRNATPDEISSAYRSLLRHHHPDTRRAGREEASSSDAALQEVIDAYRVLHNPKSRAAYDKRLRPRQQVSGARREARRDAAAASPAAEPPLRAGPVRWQPS